MFDNPNRVSAIGNQWWTQAETNTKGPTRSCVGPFVVHAQSVHVLAEFSGRDV